jgi:hypothetical protein
MRDTLLAAGWASGPVRETDFEPATGGDMKKSFLLSAVLTALFLAAFSAPASAATTSR